MDEVPKLTLRHCFSPGQTVYCNSRNKAYDNGDRVVFGAECIIVGPGKGDGKTVDVRFPWNAIRTTLPTNCLSHEPLTLAAGLQAGALVYCNSRNKIFDDGDKVIYGAECQIVGPGKRDGKTLDFQFVFNQKHVTMPVEYVSIAPACLPAGLQIGQVVYCSSWGKNFESGDAVRFGAKCELVGPGKRDGKTVDLQFAFNKRHVTLPVGFVSVEPLRLAGDYEIGQVVYCNARNKLYQNGDKLAYGASCEVVGPGWRDGRSLDLQFQFNGRPVTMPLDCVSPVPVRLPQGYQIGDMVYCLGRNRAFANGDKVLYGAECTIVGPGKRDQKSVDIQCAFNKVHVTISVEYLSRSAPCNSPSRTTRMSGAASSDQTFRTTSIPDAETIALDFRISDKSLE